MQPSMDTGWKSRLSNTEIADQIYTQFLHINIGTQILYKLLRWFIHLPIAAPIYSFTNCCADLFIYQLLQRFIQTQIHLELTIVEI